MQNDKVVQMLLQTFSCIALYRNKKDFVSHDSIQAQIVNIYFFFMTIFQTVEGDKLLSNQSP